MSMNEDFQLDPSLILEGDYELIDRLAELMDQIDEDEEQLGAVFKKFAPTIKKAAGPNLFQTLLNKTGKQKTAKTIVAKLAKKQPARQAACAGYGVPKASRLTRADLVGRSETPAPVFAVLDYKVGALSLSIKAMSGQNVRLVKAFHKGIDDDGSPYGSTTPIDDHRTNLITGGAMPDGSAFLCYGLDVDISTLDRSEMNVSDLRIFGDALLRWSVGNGAQTVQLARVAECAPTGGVVTAAGGGDELGVRFTGVPFRSKTPLFTLKGGEKGHEMQIEFPDPALELAKACRMRITLRGKHFQRMAGR